MRKPIRDYVDVTKAFEKMGASSLRLDQEICVNGRTFKIIGIDDSTTTRTIEFTELFDAFPGRGIPLDLIVRHVLPHLGYNDLANLRLVSKCWHDFLIPIIETKRREHAREFYKYVAMAKESANAIPDLSKCTRALIKIAALHPSHDIRDAKSLLNGPTNNFDKISDIVEVEARKDLPEAIKTAESCEDPYEKALAFVKIAEHDPSHDLTKAKELATSLNKAQQDRLHFEIVRVEKDFDLEQAKKTADLIESSFYKASALIDIAKLDPTHDLSKALATIDSIIAPYEKANVLLYIAELGLPHDMTKIKEIVSSIDNNTTNKVLGWLRVAKLEGSFDVTKAVEAANSMTSLPERGHAKIATFLASHDVAKAKKYVQENIPTLLFKDRVLKTIVQEEAKGDINEAIKTCSLITFDQYKYLAYLHIAEEYFRRFMVLK